MTALLPLITSAVAVLVNEQRVVRSATGQKENITLATPGFLQTSKQNMIQLWGAIKQPNVFLPTLFIFLWQATPHSDSAMFYFTYALFHLVHGRWLIVISAKMVLTTVSH